MIKVRRAQRTSVSILPLVLACCAASPVFAQTAPQEVPAADDDSADADDNPDIVVTAQRREQAINSVPLAITALSGRQLADDRVSRMADLGQVTSNVTFRETRPGGNPVITIRGVGVNDFLVSSNPAASVYVDGIYSPNLGTISGQFFDLERVEVLKGPQSTLYGRNSTAGAVNMISARPTSELSGYASGTAGNYQSLEFEGALSGPLTSNLLARLSVRTQHRYQGYMTNQFSGGDDFGTIHQTAVRGQLLWNPIDRLEIHGVVAYSHENDVPGAFTAYGRRRPGGRPGATTGFCPTDLAGLVDIANDCASVFGYRRTSTDPYVISDNDPWNVRSNSYRAGVTAIYEGDQIKVTSITGYLDWKEFRAQADGIPLSESRTERDQSTWQLSQDLQFASTNAGPLRVLGGLYASTGRTVLGTYTIAPVNGANYFVPYRATVTTGQVFGQLEYDLTSKLEVTGGLRYIHENTDKSGGTIRDNNFNRIFEPTDTVLANLEGTLKQDAVTWKVGLNYKADPSTLVYASVAKGFKSGGFPAQQAANSLQLANFEGEKIYAYEVGVKKGLLNGALQINASGFTYDYRDLQSTTTLLIGQVAVVRFGNLPEARVYGADVDVQLRPFRGFDLSATVGYLDTRIGEFRSSANAVVPAGNRLPNAPTFSGGLQGRYQFQLANDLKMSLTGSIHRQSSTFMDSENTKNLHLDTAATTIDARGELLTDSRGIAVAIWGKNLTKAAYVVNGFNSGGSAILLYNMPRTYGVTVSTKF